LRLFPDSVNAMTNTPTPETYIRQIMKENAKLIDRSNNNEKVIAIAPFPYDQYEIGYITYDDGIAPFWRNLVTMEMNETLDRFQFCDYEICAYVAIGRIAIQCARLWDDPDKWLKPASDDFF